MNLQGLQCDFPEDVRYNLTFIEDEIIFLIGLSITFSSPKFVGFVFLRNMA